MNPIADCAERALRDHSHPALRLSELAEVVAARVDRALDPERLRALLAEQPDRFRLLEPWSGAWRPVPVERGVPRSSDPWVVALTTPDDDPGRPRAALRLRESVRWLTRGVDTRSSAEVSRWYAIVLAERAAREAVVRRAA